MFSPLPPVCGMSTAQLGYSCKHHVENIVLWGWGGGVSHLILIAMKCINTKCYNRRKSSASKKSYSSLNSFLWAFLSS